MYSEDGEAVKNHELETPGNSSRDQMWFAKRVQRLFIQHQTRSLLRAIMASHGQDHFITPSPGHNIIRIFAAYKILNAAF